MSIDPYGLEPQVEPAPSFPMEEVLRLIRQGQPGPLPQQAPPGFLDRLGAGLANVQAPGGGHAGDVFGANLLAGFGRSFGGNRVAARNQDLERQMADYESGKAQKAAETQAQITGLTSDYESRGASAKESARALALWRKEKREYTAKQDADAKAAAKDTARDAREAARDTRREFESDRDYQLRVGAERRMSAKGSGGDVDTFDRTVKLRAAALQDPDIKSFIDVRDGYGRVKAGAKNQSAVGDLAVIFGYMKMLDPGSVVREGEFANAENTRGVPDHIRVQYNRLLEGAKLSTSQRTQFSNSAEQLYKTKKVPYDRAVTGLRSIGDTAGLNPEQYLRDFTIEQDAVDPFASVRGGAASSAGAPAPKPGGWFAKNAPGRK